MAVSEYESGAAFPGVIGRTADESTPAWPAPVRAREGAPNVVFIVLDDTGSGSWAVTAARSRHLASTRSRRTACGTATCTRRRCDVRS